MDRHNNAIGMRIGQAARDYNDVLQRAGSTMTATAPEGNGTWKDPHHSSPFPAPMWLPREKWQGMPSRQANWYDNPVRAQGLVFPKEWRHAKQYAFGAAEDKDGDGPSLGAILGLMRAQTPSHTISLDGIAGSIAGGRRCGSSGRHHKGKQSI